MASNVPLPSGEGSPDYYEQQFGARIRSIRKGGAPSGGVSSGGVPSGGGSRWNGGAAVGIGVGVLLAILRIANSTSHRTPVPRFDPPPVINPHLDDLDRLNKQFQDLRFQQFPLPDAQPLVLPDVLADDPNLLTQEEVPLWAGLCYRIEQESRQPRETPGKHLCALLDNDAWDLVRRAAAGEHLNGKEREELLDALNEVLANRRFYDAASFREVRPPLDAGVRAFLQGRGLGNLEEKELRQTNRALLEAAYPQQIIPVRLKDNLDAATRRDWAARAREDLAAAKKQYGSQK